MREEGNFRCALRFSGYFGRLVGDWGGLGSALKSLSKSLREAFLLKIKKEKTARARGDEDEIRLLKRHGEEEKGAQEHPGRSPKRDWSSSSSSSS